VGKCSPNLVLCTGTSYVNEFSRCFLDADDISGLNKETVTDASPRNSAPRYLYWKWINDESLFVVVPFVTNASGLNSHRLLQSFGDRIKGLLLLGSPKELT